MSEIMRNMTPAEKESYNMELSKRSTKTGRNIQRSMAMSETMQPPGPAGTTYIQHDCRSSKSITVWIDKDEATKLYAFRAAPLNCVRALEAAQPYVELSGWTRHRDAEIAQIEDAITNARKALGE